MVRHPFDRMVSAYVDKLIYGAPGFGAGFKTLSYELNAKYRHLRHNVEDRNKTDDGTATFEDFVNYLVDTNGTNRPHFSFYHTRCSVCTVHYDYIIKFETMREDIEYLQNYLNISQQHRRVLFPEAKQLTQPERMKEYFQQIPKELMLKVYDVYKNDFVLFGYDRPV
ncbi:carbohydrate sulfotransferase 11-like [Clavelina lepadiformis]|uniref:carbohydrate sulfotransferase 11-like n=1 Tax=Clavelina lepadiformis TaxID=159417 RepID=UPI0040435124